jgi:hypothetical protein
MYIRKIVESTLDQVSFGRFKVMSPPQLMHLVQFCCSSDGKMGYGHRAGHAGSGTFVGCTEKRVKRLWRRLLNAVALRIDSEVILKGFVIFISRDNTTLAQCNMALNRLQ